jgi:tricorn protease-like protein
VYLPDRDVTTDAEEPSFSPDGAWVAYWSNAPEAETYDLWLVRADGSDNHQLTNTPLVSEAHPRFSVDGRWIYYIASQADGAWNLWRIRPDGSQSSKLTGYVAGQASVATISVGKSRVVFATQHLGPLQSVTLDGDKQQAIPRHRRRLGPRARPQRQTPAPRPPDRRWQSRRLLDEPRRDRPHQPHARLLRRRRATHLVER